MITCTKVIDLDWIYEWSGRTGRPHPFTTPVIRAARATKSDAPLIAFVQAIEKTLEPT